MIRAAAARNRLATDGRVDRVDPGNRAAPEAAQVDRADRAAEPIKRAERAAEPAGRAAIAAPVRDVDAGRTTVVIAAPRAVDV